MAPCCRGAARRDPVVRGLYTAVLPAVLILMLSLLFPSSMVAAEPGRVPVTEEEGRRIAAAALRYTEVEPAGSAASERGMPFLWGGRSTVEELAQGAGVGDSAGVLGVDASGLVVNVMRTVFGSGIRFVAVVDGEEVRLADATSHILYRYNVEPVDPREARPGDLLFFGRDGDINGVAVVAERGAGRIDFVVASARAGRVIRTFARIGGEYWQNSVAGLGRFLKPVPVP